ncbi:TetR/AcrR family transcriptional regulator [Macrococcus equipercicus]|uniref:TetR/AcrR family transcriptional regulator n=1 Tax=Macrococcus equipercicus TaxID=69967 RepID=A0ABQ6R8U9_9STAP|nr:TetR/AcrR family transcriptional regulator [Macrococcus equipercicus]KAA1039548.1 TetR/AcrR family transcriptional regulator [Macrococcus equipercicus]
MRKDALENRKRIEEKAVMLFHENGVDAVSMNRISQELNIGMATLYRNFSDKAALCYQLIVNDFSDLFEQFDKIQQSSLSNKVKLQRYIDLFLTFKSDHIELLRCVEQDEKKNDFRETEIYSQLYGYFFELFNEAATFKADMLMTAMTTQSYHYQKEKRHLTNEGFREQLINLFMHEED